VLGGHDAVCAGYAGYIEYPLPDSMDLRQMAKFNSITHDLDAWELKSDYLNFVKNHLYALAAEAGVSEERLAEAEEQVDDLTVTEFAGLLNLPHFGDGQTDPLLILAGLPLPIFLTTSPYGFLARALERAGKSPRSEICRWHPGLDSEPSVFDGNYQPSVHEPLVYHLHGLDTRPDSLVLTEDDYLEFLVGVAQQQGKDTDRIASVIRQAMFDSALVLLGYNLPDWAFRVLFWGLIKPATSENKGIFTLQLEPSEVEKKYLQEYLKREAQFEVFWGDIHAYAQELRRLWRG
jgi:hypothetical protein